MFRNANNVVITGGHFTSIEGNHDTSVSTVLWHHVAAGAIFDSAERYPPGRCHPGTRKRITDQITEWIKDANGAQRILWLYGSAGSGKSAIMQSMCEFLRDSYPEFYAGSFFFAKGHTDRGKSIKLFLTLSYQLAVRFPSVRAEVNNALYQDPTLPTKSIDIQLHSLIIDALLRCNDLLSPPPILIIDGLDECDDDQGIDTQRDIITLISRSIINHNIPVRFIIASRPEYWIRDAFEASPLSNLTFSLSLRDDIDADRDIRSYLTDEFEKIRLENSRIMKSVTAPWPPKTVINRLVEEASGQYVYASTVLKFVGKASRFSDPQKQLCIIITPGPHRASAFSDLDRLYATILSAYPKKETMKRVLGGLLAKASLTIIEAVLGVDPTEITLALDALSSLINIVMPEPLSEYELLVTPIFGNLSAGTEKISFCHLSFCEFLQDETRSGPHYVDVGRIMTEITEAFFGIILRGLDQNYETEPHTFFNIGLIPYRRMMDKMADIVAQCHDIEVLVRLVNIMTASLRNINPNRRMNYVVCFMQDIEWIHVMAILSIGDDANKSKARFPSISHLRRHTNKHSEKRRENGSKITGHAYLMIGELLELSFLAYKIGMRLLSLCDGASITPALVFIDRFPRTPIKTIFTMPGNSVADTLSALRQHRHIIGKFGIGTGQDQRWFADFLDGFHPLSVKHQGWFSRLEYRNQYVLLVFSCLKLIVNHVDHVWEYPITGNYDMACRVLRAFFDSSEMSDICGKEYFANERNIAFLQLMVDSTAWMALFPSQPKSWTNLSSVISTVLCWFKRQLANPNTVSLIHDQDTSLPKKMAMTMNAIFQHCFVPIFTTPYISELRISTSPEEKERKAIKIIVLSSSCWGEETTYAAPDLPPQNYHCSSVQDVHNELFGRPLSIPGSPVEDPIIEGSCWFPYLTTYLLNVMAKFLYCQANPGFKAQVHRYLGRNIKEEFSYIVDCLPHARTSQQNLNAFRAIRFFSRMVDPWNPPRGFYSVAVEFLKKYEHCGLSSNELHAFELWLLEIQKLESSEKDKK